MLPFTFLQQEKYNPRYNIFWRFVTGLIQSCEPAAVSEHNNNKNLVGFFDLLHRKPVDLLGAVHRRLLMYCLSEVAPDDEYKIRIREREEGLLRKGLIKEYMANGTILLGQEVEFPEHILCSFLEDERHLPFTVTLNALKYRPFVSIETLHVVSDLMTHGFTTDLHMQAIAVVFKHSQMASEDVLARAFQIVHTALEHVKPSIRRSAVEILGNCSSLPQTTIATLVTMLKDDAFKVQRFATDALRQQTCLPGETITALITAIRDQNSDFEARRAAARVLRGQPSLPQEFIAILTGIFHENDDGTGIAAEYAFGPWLSPFQRAILSLLKMLNNGDQTVQFFAPDVLEGHSSLPKETIASLVTIFMDEDSSFDLRTSIADVLGYQPYLPQETINTLVMIFKDETSDMQKNAVTALRHQSYLPREAINTAISMLKDKRSPRWHAASLLECQLFLDEEVINALVTILRDEISLGKRFIVSALRNQSPLPQKATDALITALKDKNPVVRENAARALGKYSYLPQEAINALIPMIGGDSVYQILHQCDIYSKVVDLDTKAWRQLWSYWLKRDWRYDICCYQFEDLLYVWVNGLKHQMSTDLVQTQRLLDAVLDLEHQHPGNELGSKRKFSEM